jgi:hypothetical protein
MNGLSQLVLTGSQTWWKIYRKKIDNFIVHPDHRSKVDCKLTDYVDAKARAKAGIMM